MEYNMNMYAKLLHTSISRVSYEGNVVKIYGNLTDFHITYVVKKYREEKEDMENYPYLVNLCPGVTTAVVEDSEKELYLIGPVSLEEYKQVNLKKFIMQECSGQEDTSVFQKIPYCSRDRFGTTVLLVHHMLTGAELSLEDLWRRNGEKVNKNHIHERQVGSVLFERMEFENPHNPYDQEVRELNSIRNGDLESFQKSIRETYSGSEGRLSENQIRQEKNIAICVITLASRAAIEGGVLPEMAFSMVDAYIMQVEKMSDIVEIRSFMRKAEQTFLERVQENKKPKVKNMLVEDTKKFIFQHLHSKIEIGNIGNEIGVNTTYLSELFHKTEGITIQKYIQREKIKLAKNMLQYSEYKIEDIANYLGFCSQSYFGKVFREYENLTPNQFRQKYGKNTRNK